jgi:hypothetical protein
LDVQATYSIRRLASAMKNRHVDPLQKRRLDGEEVASEDGAGLRSQERPPRGRRSLGRRRETSLSQYLPHRSGGNADADSL